MKVTFLHSLRKKRITTSKFGVVARRISNFDTLVKQLQPSRLVQTAAMKRGIEMEGRAAYIYATKAKQGKVNLYPSGLVINPKCPWLESSPDRKVYDMRQLKMVHQVPVACLKRRSSKKEQPA